MTPMTMPTSTSLGLSCARYTRATPTRPITTVAAAFPYWRSRPCGTRQYSAITSRAVNTAIGREGMANPSQRPSTLTPNGRGRRTTPAMF